MGRLLTNNLRRAIQLPPDIPPPSTDANAPISLLSSCPAYAPTPLRKLSGFGVGEIWIKDETGRMGLGSFKALGAAYVIARHASERSLKDTTYVTASAGNHGLSVAAGARVFGAKSIIYLSHNVPRVFADRLSREGATVRIKGATYEESMAAAAQAAQDEGLILLSDSSWEGYVEIPRLVMEGYLAVAHEIKQQMEEPPTHVFLQAGVGGMAASLAAYFRKIWTSVIIVVVEPEAAPALLTSVESGTFKCAPGPVSIMGRLDCKEPSLIALHLAETADFFLTISDELALDISARLAKSGVVSTPSGVAGLAGVFATEIAPLELSSSSRILCVITEGQPD